MIKINVSQICKIFNGPCSIKDFVRNDQLTMKCMTKGALFLLGSPAGFFSPVLCQKFKHNLQSYQLVFLLFEYLCAPNIQKNCPQRNEGVYFCIK